MKMLKNLLAITLALLMVLSVVPVFAATAPSADGITLSRTSSYVTVGMTVQLTADADVSWSSSSDEIATVNATGLVTAVAVGVAEITATTSDGKTAVCRVNVYDVEIRNHVTAPTPDVNGGQFLTDLFDKENFKVMLPFDDSATDITGNVTTTVKDTLAYTDGFNGKAASFKDGYVELTDAVLGSGSITISTWLKPQTVTAVNEFVISTTPLNPGSNIFDGFYTSLKSTATDIFYIRTAYEGNANGFRRSESLAVGTDTPSDIYDGWVNFTWVFDKENKKMYTYIDYEQVMNKKFTYPDAVWDGEWAPLLGRGRKKDATNFNTYKYDGLMDDFFIYDGAMTVDDIAKLKAYYNLVQAVPTENVSLNTSTLSLSINEASTLTATVTPANATVTDVIWSTSDANVATVNGGKVRATGAGIATITATTKDGGFVACCQVKVSDNVEPFLYDRVCIIGVDGGGTWLNDDYMTNVNAMFEDGATTETCQVSLPSVSAPGWSSIIHGVTPGYLNVTNYTGALFPFPEDSPYPSFFRILHETRPDAVMASFSSYATVNVGIIENNIGVHKASRADEALQPMILDYLDENDPEILFIHYGDVDHVGHQVGYGSDIQEYADVMKVTDNYIGEIYDKYEEKGLLDTTLFILTADHGGTSSGSHGANSPEEVNVFLGLQGPGVKKNSTIADARNHDVAAIVAHALGLERHENWLAKVPDGAFDGVFGQTRNDVPFPTSDYRDHINMKTPSKEGTHLTDIFGEENFEFLYEFDGEVKDLTGNHTSTINKNITFKEGYFGQGADFSQGSVSLDAVDIGNSSITIGAWIKTNGFSNRALLMADKGLNATEQGFYFTMDKTFATLAIKGEESRISFSNNYYPTDMYDGWTHILLVIDKTNGNTELYYDFNLSNGLKISTTALSIGDAPITIGSTGDAKHPYPLTATLDDVFIYNGAMTDEDIAKLKAYYGKEGTQLKISDVVFGNAVSFDFDVAGDINDSNIYAAVYDENMKLLNVKKFPTRIAGGESVENAADAKHLKVFVIGDDLVPKCAESSLSKN